MTVDGRKGASVAGVVFGLLAALAVLADTVALWRCKDVKLT